MTEKTVIERLRAAAVGAQHHMDARLFDEAADAMPPAAVPQAQFVGDQDRARKHLARVWTIAATDSF